LSLQAIWKIITG